MTPEYIEELAELADPEQLWRLSGLEHMDLPKEKRLQLDAGIALRRQAQQVLRLRELLEANRSLLITPISRSCTATMSTDTPTKHAKLRKRAYA